ncbi:d-alanine--d-alanine ligase [Seminavis robusta]|uniref:D-alanine--d-alanine ligase n=1 Tax=Seminavis robusta TaxID=568900 RepID=A0A9N8HGS0_9STRA|nr:d-alanine--d-alanine ligase [Seminavis robusta]|eukprot:Sro524_g159880.1 d-alanine--d-alanine ligase (382) ;mRNA; f:4471-5616
MTTITFWDADRDITCQASIDAAAQRAPWLRFFFWEFWPSLSAYLPVLPALLYSYICIGLSPRSPTAVNPAIPSGGFFGESKNDILLQLAKDNIAKTLYFPMNGSSDDPKKRKAEILKSAQIAGISMPFILKPDKGERGNGVYLVKEDDAMNGTLLRYLEQMKTMDLICQEFVQGSEVGIFYMHYPDAKEGFIYSIVAKEFPYVVGDGKSTLASLIASHPRHRLFADTFFKRHAERLLSVLPKGEEFQLTYLGNHGKGTLCLDGSHLITAALAKQVDKIAKQFDGFYFGRFDFLYDGTKEDLKDGKATLKVIELNGMTSELLSVYDPGMSMFQRYKLAIGQWLHAYRIGAANHRRGHKLSTLGELWEEYNSHWEESANVLNS